MSIRFDRRDWMNFALHGLAWSSVCSLAQRETRASSSVDETISAHHAPRARRAIQITLTGGFSQVDTFDPKPELVRRHGQPLPGSVQPETFFGSAGALCQSHWRFRRRGESGLEVSDLFPHIAEVADHLTVIRSMVAETANHTPATFQQLTGFQSNGFPVMGSWLSYGLGCESESLPTFVVLPDARSQPSGGTANWAAGFLPAEHQGVMLHSSGEPIRNLSRPARLSAAEDLAATRALEQLERDRLEQEPDNAFLRARLQAYELAARMQVAIPETLELAQETQATLDAYGVGREPTDDCGRRCLTARRLLERGVRFVQLYSGGCFGGTPRHGWDSHENCPEDHTREALRIDQPIAALLRDLHQRGMLDDTLVLFTTEFGRTPFANAPAGVAGLGRDHNPEGFSVWMAGGGLKPGMAFGATDEFGWRSVENPVTWPDFHATVLHLLGLDHERLTFYHNGIERRLTNVHGQVLSELLA